MNPKDEQKLRHQEARAQHANGSYVTPKGEHLCQFGKFDVKTGAISDGYTDESGQMKFKFNFWESIKNKIRFILFGNPYKPIKLKPKIEVLEEIPLFRRSCVTGEERSEGSVMVYRKFESDTGRTLRIWSRNIHGIKVFGDDEYDIDIWEQTGMLEKK